MALFRENTLGIEKVGVTVSIPSNIYSKLKYYLKCVACTLNIGEELAEFIDYANPKNNSLTLAQKKALVTLCALFSPDELAGKCWFNKEDLDSSNEFFKLSHVENTLAVSENIFIGAQSRRVLQVMFFKMAWIQNFYIGPMKLAIDDIKAETNRKNLILNLNHIIIKSDNNRSI